MTHFLLQALAAAIVLLVGCGTHPPRTSNTSGSSRAEAAKYALSGSRSNELPRLPEVYARSNAWFTAAVLWKPAESDQEPSSSFAPLLMLESNRQSDTAPFFSGNSALAKVYMSSDVLSLGERNHVRLTYVWERRGFLPSDAQAIKQGIRITLDRDGQPVVWEVLSDRPGLRQIYVARSLETRAAAVFGKPLPGRSFSVEPELSSFPDIVVPRVLEDGPLPMGPIVYLDSNGGVATVICRCMPGQATSVIGTSMYQLQPTAGILQESLDDRAIRSLRLPDNW